MSLNVIFGIVHILNGSLIILLSVPLVRRQIEMNRLYGVRIKKSFESEENWYAINAYGGKQLIIWSIAMVVAGTMMILLPAMPDGKTVLTIVIGLTPVTLFLAIAVIRTLKFAKNL